MSKAHLRLISRVRKCEYPHATNAIGGKLYLACDAGNLMVLDAQGHALARGYVKMDGINMILPAGRGAIAVLGFNAGATLRSGLTILRAPSLKPIVRHSMEDSTFLGVLGSRVYVDDWCCFGRAGVYRPATIYWVSLKNGAESEHIDLTPDPGAHPGNLQPLGQGEHNYLIGPYFYVVVGPVTYRYDVRDLKAMPKRLISFPHEYLGH